MKASYLYACDAAQPHALEYAGEPVWPVASEEQWKALERLAALWGCELRRCPEAQPVPSPTEGAAVVAFFDPSHAALAGLYAHLTGRTARKLTGVEAIGTDAPEILLLNEASVGEELLETLYCTERPFAPGLVIGEDEADLWREVLVRSAAARFDSTLAVRRIHLATGLEFKRVDVAADWRLLGDLADYEEVHAGLTCGAGLVSLTTHSDGVDTALTPNLVLCAMNNAPREGELKPLCVTTGSCFRRNIPLSEITTSKQHVFGSEIRSRIFAGFTCFGLRPAPEVFGRAWSLPRALRRDATIGAYVSSWEVTSLDAESIEVFCRSIGRGLPVGEVVATFNNQSRRERRFARLLILGDPRTALPAPPPGHIATQAPQFPTMPKRTLPDMTFVRMAMRGMTLGLCKGPQGRERPVLEAVDAFEIATLYGDDDDFAQAEAAFYASLFDAIVVNYNSLFSRVWAPFARGDRLVTDRPPRRCTVCSRLTAVTEVELAVPRSARRVVEQCTNCGPITDLPAGREVTIRIGKAGGVEISGDIPPRAIQIRALIDTPLASEKRGVPWPTEADGSPAKSFDVPSWPSLPLRVAVLLAWSPAEVGAVGMFVRGETLRTGQRPAV